MRGTVLEILDDVVRIGVNGKIEEIHISNFDFRPKVNDRVEIFKNENTIIIKKLENLNARKVNKVIYLICAFFLGGLGVHKFYSGKTVQGVLYLVFCWTFIPSFLALIDFFIGLFKSSDSNGDILV